MKIIVEEEYGYKYYMWTTPFENTEDLIRWWNGVNPESIIKSVFPVGTESSSENHQRIFGGSWLPCNPEDIHGPGDGYMHLHMPEDSYLEIGEGRYFVDMENSDEHSTVS